jgi:DNA-binding CsgD family transcriptional regulator
MARPSVQIEGRSCDGAVEERYQRATGTGARTPSYSRLVHRRRLDSPIERLSEREREVLSLMAEGRSNQAIAERLWMAPKTVEIHVSNIFTKLGLLPAPEDHRRVLAVLAFLRA